MRNEFVTVVIKYAPEQKQPSFHANMEALGGTVTAVMFDDALARLEKCECDLADTIDRLSG